MNKRQEMNGQMCQNNGQNGEMNENNEWKQLGK